MMQQLWASIEWLLGLQVSQTQLSSGQMIVRAVVVYLAVLMMIRVGEKRLLGKSTAFDVVLSVILGSMASRAINGAAPFFPTLAAGIALVALHFVFAAIAFRSPWFNLLVKGDSRLLVKDGQILWNAMRASHIGEKELMAAIRTNAQITDLQEVKSARLELNGAISVVPVQQEPQVIQVEVAEGVQTIRIEIDHNR